MAQLGPIQNPIGSAGITPENTRGIDPAVTPIQTSMPIQTPAKAPTIPKNAGSTTGATIGTLAGGPVGTAVGAGVGKLIDIGMTIYGQRKADARDKKNRELNAQWAQIQNDIAKKENARQWKWAEEERNYSRASDFVGNMVGMMNADIGLKNNLVNLWRSKK